MLQIYKSKYQPTIDHNAIIRIEAIGNYSKIHLENGQKIIVAKVLKWFEEQIVSDAFIRVNRSNLINLSYTQSISINNSLPSIQLNGHKFTISRRRYKYIKPTLLKTIV